MAMVFEMGEMRNNFEETLKAAWMFQKWTALDLLLEQNELKIPQLSSSTLPPALYMHIPLLY